MSYTMSVIPPRFPTYGKFELTMDDGTPEFSREEISELFKALLEEATHAS